MKRNPFLITPAAKKMSGGEGRILSEGRKRLDSLHIIMSHISAPSFHDPELK